MLGKLNCALWKCEGELLELLLLLILLLLLLILLPVLVVLDIEFSLEGGPGGPN